MMIRIVVPLAALLVLSIGCGGKGPDDPITGTWSNANCYGDTTMPADIQSCKLSVRFDADLSVTLINSRQSLPATATFPRCITNRTVSGMKYSTDNMGTLTLTGSSMSTLERKECANVADNQATMADTRDSLSAGKISYTITTKTLTITSGQLTGEYTRQ